MTLLRAFVFGLAMTGIAAAHERPQIDAATAATMHVADYLAQGPSPWVPPAAVDVTAAPDFTVAADGSGTHRTLQAAIDALPPRSAGARRYVIRMLPGVYREIVCARDKVPFTLFGSAGDPAAVVVIEGRYNALPKRAGVDPANPCDPQLDAASYGTPGSASVALFSDDVHVAHLTIANDSMERVRDGIGYPPGAGESGGAQGVALMTQGDRVLLDNVRLVGHQDTLMVRTPRDAGDAGRAARVLVRRSLIAGDVDFVFGDATLVVDDCTVLSRAGRRLPGNGGHVLAPSTAPAQRLGMLVINSRLFAEAGVAAASVSLGRAWDAGVARGAWQAGVSPNGQALVRDSVVGAHIGPWSPSTSRRPFSSTGEMANRMAEHGNRLLPDDRAHEVLGANDGWAAAGGGTTGGAGALPADTHVVHNRAELVAALAAAHARPRIVKVAAMIDLNTGADGRVLTEADYRAAGFGWAGYDGSGALEQARLASARRQAAHVVLRVPSNTTLIGAAPGAGVTGGMLLLDRVHNVIVRHLQLRDAYDFFPQWDPGDNGGSWNADYDNLALRGATRVWIAHNRFDDGDRPRHPIRNHHDGLLDITRQSNLITVSWNVFAEHDKTALVGGSDKHVDDDGRLKVSFHHNLWQRVKERAPRVRFGRVHVYNNLYVDAGNYSIGVGVGSRVFSENNAWEGALPADRLVRAFGGERFVDRGSLHNGSPVVLGAGLQRDVGWTPWLHGIVDAAADVPARVRAGAGPRP